MQKNCYLLPGFANDFNKKHIVLGIYKKICFTTPRYFEKTGCQTIKILYTPIDAYFYHFWSKKRAFKEYFFLYAPEQPATSEN